MCRYCDWYWDAREPDPCTPCENGDPCWDHGENLDLPAEPDPNLIPESEVA